MANVESIVVRAEWNWELECYLGGIEVTLMFGATRHLYKHSFRAWKDGHDHVAANQVREILKSMTTLLDTVSNADMATHGEVVQRYL